MRVIRIQGGFRRTIIAAGLVVFPIVALLYALMGAMGEGRASVAERIAGPAQSSLDSAATKSGEYPSAQEELVTAKPPASSEAVPKGSGPASLPVPSSRSSIAADPPALPKKRINSIGDRIIKGVYIPFFAIPHPGMRDHVFKLLESTEINAVVMDVKGDRGWVAYPSSVPLAKEVAQGQITMPDVDSLIAHFGERGVYPIARIVVFKDNPLAKAHPDLAVKDSTGGLWIDSEGLAWTDPFNEKVWEYNVEIAKETALLGFREIQFDYIRFPTDGYVSRAVYSKASTPESRIAAISGFLALARRELEPLGVKVAMDTFGYTTWRDDDMGIGQQLEALAPYLDVLSPMLYPSTYADGIPGIQDPVAHPYEIVYESALRAVRRVEGAGVEVRPWIQGFRDYAFDRRDYGAAEMKAQEKAAYDSGSTGWMVWDPWVAYPAAAFDPPSAEDELPPWSVPWLMPSGDI